MGERMGHRMRGYVEISVHDGLPERFFNLCALQGMEVWNIRMGKNGDYRCRVELKDFWGVRPLARKARVRLKVKKRGGIPFFLSENRKRVRAGRFFPRSVSYEPFSVGNPFHGKCALHRRRAALLAGTERDTDRRFKGECPL